MTRKFKLFGMQVSFVQVQIGSCAMNSNAGRNWLCVVLRLFRDFRMYSLKWCRCTYISRDTNTCVSFWNYQHNPPCLTGRYTMRWQFHSPKNLYQSNTRDNSDIFRSSSSTVFQRKKNCGKKERKRGNKNDKAMVTRFIFYFFFFFFFLLSVHLLSYFERSLIQRCKNTVIARNAWEKYIKCVKNGFYSSI